MTSEACEEDIATRFIYCSHASSLVMQAWRVDEHDLGPRDGSAAQYALRVVCGLASRMLHLAAPPALTAVDLPPLGRPTMAT